MRLLSWTLTTLTLSSITAIASEITSTVPKQIFDIPAIISSKFPEAASGINSKRDDESEEVKIARRSVKSVIEDLRRYLAPLIFYSGSFQSNQIELELRLLEVADIASKISRPMNKFAKELSFAKEMFKEMSDYIVFEKLFPANQGPDYRILNSIMQLNLSLNSLRDDKGKPDQSVKDYHTLLLSFRTTLLAWENAFGRSGPVCSPLQILFSRQVEKAYFSFSEFRVANDDPEVYRK